MLLYVFVCVVWQKPTQHCKAVILHLKKKKELNPEKNKECLEFGIYYVSVVKLWQREKYTSISIIAQR